MAAHRTPSQSPVHLRVVAPVLADASRKERWLVLLLGLTGVAFLASAFFASWWSFWLYAPQYPGGLRLDISLTGMGGDVHEIDLLNHYIGMAHLEDAAPLERSLAGYVVVGIGVATLALLVAAGRKMNGWVVVPALALPVGFLADSAYWLYAFGHHLDKHAPLKIGGFTPQLFGSGKIGQFETYAQPALGFWLAIGGALLVCAATLVRVRVCRRCARAGACDHACARFLVLPEGSKK